MTTEVGSASEVKKDSDQLGADVTKEKAKQVAENQQHQSSEPEEEKGSQPPPPAESQSSPHRQKREKDTSESRGISRFIPPWLKKQKSYNLVVAKDGGDKKEPTEAVVEEQILDKEVSLPEEERQAKGDAEETAQSKHQEVKVEVKEGKPSVSKAETQPAEEVREEREEVKEIQEDEVAAPRETKEVQTNELKAEKTSQKATKKTKTVQCKVTLLDGTEYSCDLEKRAKGQVLIDKVCEHLNLLEKDYFGLLFQENTEQKNWLDPAKEIKRQLRNLPWLFTFNVKFYPPDPSQLTEDITRYFLCLQLRKDIASGRLPCSFVTHALLGSYTLQAELGDYDPEEHSSIDLSDFQFAPTQTKELEEKVAELHKTHRGLSPAQADSQFLENAKRLSMYGVDLHHAKDSEGVDIKLGVCANGLLIYKDRLRINRFAWPKILKISYKRSNFYIKVRPAELEQFESTIGFKLPNHRAAKRLWKVCVEHHTFYRLVSPEQPPKAKFLTLGSKFRYSGRTQAQTRQASILIDRPAPHFDRTSSKRVSRSLDGAPIGVVDQSLIKDFPGPAGGISAYGPGVVSTAMVQDRDSRRDVRSPSKAPHLQLIEGKKNSLRVEGDNIYVRHSNLMLEDLDKAQEDILKHQASISELKRNFMESTPEPRPNEWEKRRITPLSLQTQGSLEEEITSILFSGKGFSDSMKATFLSANTWTAEGALVNPNAPPREKLSSSPFSHLPETRAPASEGPCTGARDAVKSSHETLNVVEEKKQAEVGKDERVITEEMNGKEISPGSGPGEIRKVEPVTQKDSTSLSSESSSSSESEEEDVGEYRPHHHVTEGTLREEQEEYEEETEEEPSGAAKVVEREEAVPEASPGRQAGASVITVETVAQENVVAQKISAEKSINEGTVKQDMGEETEEEQHKVNGEVSHVDIDVLPQIICCSEPPVVKTEMVTISDASQRTEISTKEVPIVQTETKTITYESPQIDGGAGGDSGTLLTAQTITSESVSTTTTTHITKTVKGGISETRIEKRIVITGDADIDHDQALAQAIREAKEQHPDMSVTRVVVHKETELAEEGEE
ncbi:erythrocyte membrane protein band 4.1 like 2, transcript variant X3 [Ictidomys tridecemlineatus]|uniref:band 4.1-like protein 2 isoform X4 n=1 Tax=Ictidomys tridecemlineatus TaxID=43179 RepID=UPI000B53B68F|nr:band 4.1-like protein 2 isoform X4 [Ictidomys tridecemlineatus]KAG3290228.1 erythrocyte membrane protein band 4.1 like 2, transcript variant X5 [Ictidomys tridecemlineatus]KAG3290236.1 erythrocyte membrane protein band 4.1 like 2, transcript variant X1 [Ictidomys tridecemlineatus]KAG3290246.1 erythrocyte membrane protein band 4.1 like 2, transcript variant X7 [Ictidomys tridecemlineatus]KAG3290247.1 erythrocyte membrane protein band 4.1 like 2, transcript variant X6 [Ictidomys tridecemlineat